MPPRTTQHKPQRDAARARELAELKQENKHLKRQIARLRKYIEKLQGVGVVEEYEEPEITQEVEQSEEESSDSQKCPNCKNHLIIIKTPTTKIVGCTNCKWRQK